MSTVLTALDVGMTVLVTAAPTPTTSAPSAGMSVRDLALMVLFALSMVIVGYLVWRLVNWKDPPGAP